MKNEKLTMKNVQKSGLSLTLLILSLFVFAACDDPFELNEAGMLGVEDGYGRISISFEAGETVVPNLVPNLVPDMEPNSARTVLPLVPEYNNYVYTFTKAGGTIGVEIEPENGFFTLEIGNYTVEVQAFTGSPGSYTLAARGASGEFYVAGGYNDPVPVYLARLSEGEGNGEFTFTITWPAGAEGEITLQSWPQQNDIALNPSNVSGGNGKTQTLNLASGSYMLTALISKDSKYAGKSEAVQIYAGLKTKYEKDFIDDDLIPFTPITNVSLSVTAPYRYGVPSTTATAQGTANFDIGEVSWSPDHNPFQASTVYTATVTLTAHDRHTFAGLSYANISGRSAAIVVNTGTTVTLSAAFSATVSKSVTNMVIKTQPTKLEYVSGNQLDLNGMEVTLTYDDETTEDVPSANFSARSITTTPAQGTALYHMTHNGMTVTITRGNFTLYTDNLIVGKGTQAFPSYYVTFPITRVYTPTLTLGDIPLEDGFEWVDPTASVSGGSGQFAAVFTSPTGNYNPVTGNITVTVTRAVGQAVSAPTLDAQTHDSIIVSPMSVPGQTVEYAINTINSVPTTWQSGITFAGLQPNTTYYIFARSAQNNNYNTGTPSGSLSVTILQPTPNRMEYYWVNEHGSLVTTSSGAVTITAGQPLTIAAQSAGYTVRQWHVDGVNTGQSGNTFDFINMEDGEHIVGLFVEKGGKLYNTNIIITVKKIEVTYDINGGMGITPDVQEVRWGTTITLPQGNGLFKTDRFFNGWNTSADGKGYRYDAAYLPTENVTLYAQWDSILTEDTWANGEFLESGGREQWFAFTATADTQYIHVSYGTGTLSTLYVQVYDSSRNAVGDRSDMNIYAIPYFSRQLTAGEVYYIQVTTNPNTNYTGNYRISFNTWLLPPNATITPLTGNWTNGSFSTGNVVRWYSFTATAATQYIHFQLLGSNVDLQYMTVDVYKANHDTVGTQQTVYGSLGDKRTINRTSLTVGEVYYVCLQYSSLGSRLGSWQITSNTSSTAP